LSIAIVFERFHEAPCGTVDHRFERRVDVFCGTASPFLTTRNELELHDAFRAESNGDDAVEVLRRGGQDHAD
jgi:hypothetical protein